MVVNEVVLNAAKQPGAPEVSIAPLVAPIVPSALTVWPQITGERIAATIQGPVLLRKRQFNNDLRVFDTRIHPQTCTYTHI